MTAGGIQESLLETPTYIIAIVLVGFQIAAMAFAFLMGRTKHALRRRKKAGLLQAVTHMQEELMLVGFISLCLIALQQPLTSICVKASPKRAEWSMLHHVYSSSCDCCLANTKYVNPCILDFAKCGNETNPYVNCACSGGGGTCSAQLSGAATALAGDASHGTGVVDSAHPSDNAAPAHGATGGDATAGDGHVAAPVGQDDHHVATPSGSAVQAAAAPAAANAAHGVVTTAEEPRGHAPSHALAVDAAHADITETDAWPTITADEAGSHVPTGEAGSHVSTNAPAVAITADKAGGHVPTNPLAVDAAHATITETDAWHATTDAGHGKRRRSLLSGGAHATAAAVCEGAVTLKGDCPQGQMPAVSYLALEQVHLLIFTVTVVHVLCGFLLYFGALGRIHFQWARWDKLDTPQIREVRAELQKYHDALSLEPGKDKPILGGLAEMLPSDPPAVDLEGQEGAAIDVPSRRTKFAASIREGVICLCLGLSPRVVTPDQYARMRASFFLTHKLSEKFNFLDFVQSSLEEDLSHVVGLSLEFWVVIVLFVLMSGPWGFLTMIFMAANGAMLILTNGKLAGIIRTVTQPGRVSRLSSNVFWFNRPPVMLIPIKFTLFLCSFVYAWFLFSVWQFSAHSCPFSDSFYPFYVLPWWTILVFNTIIFLHLAVTTLPTYSLAVQMGSDWKVHMMPKRLTKRLLAVAESTSRKAKTLASAGGDMSCRGSQALEQSAHGGGGQQELPASQNGAAHPQERSAPVNRMERVLSGVVRHIVGANHDH